MDCLIVGKVWPEPSSTAAGRRTQDLMNALQLGGWQVHFASAAQPGAHALDLEQLGVQAHRIAVNDAGFDTWIQALAPDVVIFDRFMTEEQFGWRVARCCPNTLRVLDTSDLHCLRVARERALKTGESIQLRNETALREIAAIYRSDLTLMISEYEMELLSQEFSVADYQLGYWPFALSLSRPVPNFEARSNFIMIGSFLHAPNVDALRWCRQAIWPLIRTALPAAELHFYGSYGERYGPELHAPKDGFHYKGRAIDALATMAEYRVNLAPLRYGAGLKGKVFDGFQSGTPTVMTAIAAEGICAVPNGAQDEAVAFAKAAIKLNLDSQAWASCQQEQYLLCNERFYLPYWQPRLMDILLQAYDQKTARRARNFVGQMLCHHQHRSTEFMSRWIEAKNK
ncbi:glycosyltransferase [Coraliomargarita sp. SDUM461004]|uniref:Glycosyltransferase n=1 Tax=Thalassobacterium sedimentorum TaxID=3041258 RepID=A0ABU1AJJ8_9BACT|nr:glycosyltransferase [Coraliomargarita sp. SDUM461004]MDQ8194996.1 glycosyltransferase [Coraliomargarita sp. SDUM461004]